MLEKIKKLIKSIPSRLVDKNKNKKVINISTYVVLTFVAIGMTIMNAFTDVGVLFYCTLIFSILCIVNIVLTLLVKNGEKIARGVFGLEIIIMFTFFIITGNPHGFSIIWITLLPPIAMLFYDRKQGTIISALMFVILIFFLWTPWGKSLLLEEAVNGYSDVFKLRFPFLYIGCFCLAYILATIQNWAFNAVEKASREYKFLMVHDQLTKLYNRVGFKEALDSDGKYDKCEKVGICILDIDKFKTINDVYGHAAGDEVLVTFANLLKTKLNVICCRWGGDEFAFVYFDDDVTKALLEDFRKEVEKTEVEFNGNKIAISISVGVFEIKKDDIMTIDKCIKFADDALYEAKTHGRNQIVYHK